MVLISCFGEGERGKCRLGELRLGILTGCGDKGMFSYMGTAAVSAGPPPPPNSVVYGGSHGVLVLGDLYRLLKIDEFVLFSSPKS